MHHNDFKTYTDVNMERQGEFNSFCRNFDDNEIIPKIFKDFEKDYLAGMKFIKLMEKYKINKWLAKRIKQLCEKRIARRSARRSVGLFAL